jgi:hypothetical protein
MGDRVDPALWGGVLAGTAGGAALALLIAPWPAERKNVARDAIAALYERLRKEIDDAVRVGQATARRRRAELEESLRR